MLSIKMFIKQSKHRESPEITADFTPKRKFAHAVPNMKLVFGDLHAGVWALSQ